jgi:hypothetical protein
MFAPSICQIATVPLSAHHKMSFLPSPLIVTELKIGESGPLRARQPSGWVIVPATWMSIEAPPYVELSAPYGDQG